MASSTIAVLRINLAQACVEGALYGIFLVLATTSLSLLVARRWRNYNGTSTLFVGGTILKSPLVIGTLLFFITVGGHWCTTVLRLFRSVDYEGGRHMAEYYLVAGAAPHVVSSALVVASVIVGDAIMAYRVWIVWDKRIVTIIFPALCTCAYIGAGISIVHLFTVFRPEENIFVAASKRRIVTMAALTLSTNIYGTGCIAYRIWSINRIMKYERASSPGMSLSEILVIFVESAALYTSWTFFFLASYIASSPLEAFACHCIPVATGISFMLIIVRVGLGFSWAEHEGSQLVVSVCAIGSVAAARLGSQNDLMATYPLRMIVSVTQTVEKEVIDFALPRVGNNADSDSESTFGV